MSEHKLQNEIRNILAGHCLTFRANVGQAWQGEEHRLPNGDLLLKKPRPFNSGLPKGFADLFGLVPIIITQDMVGQTIGQFFALEVKGPKGRTTEYQAAFLRAVEMNGGKSAVVRSADDAIVIISK